MNKAVVMCGSHPRHAYLASVLQQAGRLSALVLEHRESFMPQPPEHLSAHDKDNFRLHFNRRDEAEAKYFGQVDVAQLKAAVPTLEVEREELNSQKTVDFVAAASGQLLLSYGVHKLGEEILATRPGWCFNLHGGLSPFFKGTATLFWPFYLLRPNWAGMTLHRLSAALDGGEILHQCCPPLQQGDGIHDVACKALVTMADDLLKILERMDDGTPPVCREQKGPSRMFLVEDFRAPMLRLIYDIYEDRMVDRLLDGTLKSEPPQLVSML